MQTREAATPYLTPPNFPRIMSNSTSLLISLLGALLLQVYAGARCKNSCQILTPTVEGASLELLTLLFPVESKEISLLFFDS